VGLYSSISTSAPELLSINTTPWLRNHSNTANFPRLCPQERPISQPRRNSTACLRRARLSSTLPLKVLVSTNIHPNSLHSLPLELFEVLIEDDALSYTLWRRRRQRTRIPRSNNVEERADQVARMGRVYANASRVVVYLGTWAPAAAAFSCIEAIGKSNEQHHNKDIQHGLQHADHRLDTILDVDLTSLSQLFDLSWWKRLWTVQEFVLARNVILQSDYSLLTQVIWRNLTKPVNPFILIQGWRACGMICS
jgi:hypothetical protein